MKERDAKLGMVVMVKRHFTGRGYYDPSWGREEDSKQYVGEIGTISSIDYMRCGISLLKRKVIKQFPTRCFQPYLGDNVLHGVELTGIDLALHQSCDLLWKKKFSKIDTSVAPVSNEWRELEEELNAVHKSKSKSASG